VPEAPAEQPPRARAEAVRANLRALLPYLVASAIFIAIGVAEPKFMLNWAPGIALLLLVCWVLPTLWKRWRRR
jgi:hypothetical protein